ncbi:uncharacterized protein N7483_011900 [Penicillium malachiteum]|uniref:uncharacterized protein n=1 Tax=Penicillium malachiteum TaxID=1324776 RepID=UPI0025474466|nr:uncharacterized protein N7483_011900 [Penicillium malachiteum]KAJ5714719.1 hypothetical protein N7483_011900 [Penicillium malachiteum]
MPHQPRAVSPVAFEECSLLPPHVDSDPYDLLGSDDELDDEARAAKRHRIERLAESYLRGQRLFIASASLRGPFDDGWKNPWRKERRAITKSDTLAGAKGQKNTSRKAPAPACVQETNMKHVKHKSNLTLVSRAATSPLHVARETILPEIPKSVQRAQSAFVHPGSVVRDSPRLPKTYTAASGAEDDHTFLGVGSVDWLKKDRKSKHMSYRTFEPPTSPTPHSGYRRSAEKRSRDDVSISEAPVSSRASPHLTPRKNTHITRKSSEPIINHQSPAVRSPPESSESSSGGDVPYRANDDIIDSLEHHEQGTSFRVMSSTSQLARFEYRQLRVPRLSPRVSSNPLVMEDTTAEPAPSPSQDSNDEVAGAAQDEEEDEEQEDVEEPGDQMEPEIVPNNELMEVDEDIQDQGPPNPPVQLSKSIRFADDTDGGNSTNTSLPPPTEQDTYEELPSAQQVPVPPGISDRIPSLHSTVLPKEASRTEVNSTSDAQLSTQAALSLAQKSFMDDLESPMHQYGVTPGHQRGIDPADESLLALETPLFRPGTSERAPPRSFGQSEKGKMHAMSTQCMLDAATPFTFSTGKKPRAFRSISPQKTNPIKPRALHFAENASPSPDPTQRSHHESPTPKHSPPNNHVDTHVNRSTTETTSLPLALSGSTPTASQDGQAGVWADSFNLNQALADAGTWLQQSFDFMKDVGRSSQKGQVSSEAAPSASQL